MHRFRIAFVLVPLSVGGLAACAAEATHAEPPVDAGASEPFDAAPPPDADDKKAVDGGFEGPGGVVLRADRFATAVTSFTPGECAGYGIPNMPGVVLGPPVGGGALAGSLDVVTLGVGGTIVLGFGDNAIVDGPGSDFLVFENPFFVNGDPNRPNAELGEVSVSEDGVSWTTFACTPGDAPPYGSCAGWHPVLSAPGNGVSPVDPQKAGGDAFDLAEIGVSRARFIRVRDLSNGASCPTKPPKPTNVGFDLDAVAIVNAATP